MRSSGLWHQPLLVRDAAKTPRPDEAPYPAGLKSGNAEEPAVEEPIVEEAAAVDAAPVAEAPAPAVDEAPAAEAAPEAPAASDEGKEG